MNDTKPCHECGQPTLPDFIREWLEQQRDWNKTGTTNPVMLYCSRRAGELLQTYPSTEQHWKDCHDCD